MQPAFPGFTTQALEILSVFTAAAGTLRSEDCLTLNIWSKPTANSLKAEKPVLILFHGGRQSLLDCTDSIPELTLTVGFAGGNTNTPFANGQYLAESEDIVVVSVNYRLNVFGFPGAPDTDTNLGLRDQRLAAEWVRDNIAAFGGSPKKIVITGQSSGAAVVDWWSYTYKHDPIIHGLIGTSGNAFSFPMNTAQRQKENLYNLSATL